MIPANRPIKVGEILLDIQSGNRFNVLCNCSRSLPRKHTQRYIMQNLIEFDLPGVQNAPIANQNV